MPRLPRLTPDELSAALGDLPQWSGDADGLHRSVELGSFPIAVDALVAIADVAEQLNHHPDIDLRWRTLHLTLVTHSAGGVTGADLELARRIDEVLAEYTKPLDPDLLGRIDALFDKSRRAGGGGPEDASRRS